MASIRGWWRHEGRRLYIGATTILIPADGGGSNGWRLRLWKVELQKFSDATNLPISARHFPSGASKWNKVENRLFPFISSTWREERLRDYETVVNLIAKTASAKGLKAARGLDRSAYPTGRKIGIGIDEMKRLNHKLNEFHGEWNYQVSVAKQVF